MIKRIITLILFICLFQGGTAMALSLTSTAFKANESIPKKYTCDGDNVSPPLQWSGAPKNTQSFALIVDDPDAPKGVWNHWIVFNIPANVSSLPENMKTLPTRALEGKTSFGKAGYGGPCPPQGEHRYFFKLYALDGVLPFSSGATKAQLEAAMKNHILEQTELMAKYKR